MDASVRLPTLSQQRRILGFADIRNFLKVDGLRWALNPFHEAPLLKWSQYDTELICIYALLIFFYSCVNNLILCYSKTTLETATAVNSIEI